MHILKAFYAIVQGFKLCCFNRDIRKLAMWPWLIGAVSYLCAAFVAVNVHAPILNWLVGSPDGFLAQVVFYLAWVGVAIFLVISVLILSFVIVMIFGSVFQAAIAQKVLRDVGIDLPEGEAGLDGVFREVMRSITTETIKLLWLLPLGLIALVLGFIPFLIPIAIIMASWLLAYESVDIVLEVLQMKAKARFGFASKNVLPLTLFGLTLTAVGLIPFVGLFLPPVAVAGGAWFLSEIGKLEVSNVIPIDSD